MGREGDSFTVMSDFIWESYYTDNAIFVSTGIKKDNADVTFVKAICPLSEFEIGGAFSNEENAWLAMAVGLRGERNTSREMVTAMSGKSWLDGRDDIIDTVDIIGSLIIAENEQE